MFVHSTKTTKTSKIQDSIEIVKEVLQDFVKEKDTDEGVKEI